MSTIICKRIYYSWWNFFEYTSRNKTIRFENIKEERLIFQVDEGHNSKQTANKYRTDFRHFLDYIRIHDLDVLLDLGKEAIQELVIKYTLSLRDNADKKYARSTVNTRIAPILYFLDNNDIELNRRKIKRYYPSDESVYYDADRPYTTEEIAKILSVCDLRTKVMILLMASACVRIGALHTRQIDDLTKLERFSLLYKVQVYARTRDKYYTFTAPECAKAIDEYLDYRQRCGEDLKDKDKSPLFRKHFNKDDPFTINVPEFLSQFAVMKSVDKCLKRLGTRSKSGDEVMRSHAFRKGFKSICKQSGMKSINVEMLLGHDIGVSGHYYKPAESDLLEDYISHAADALIIDPTKRLQQENQELRKASMDYLAELGDLREEFNEMKQFLVGIGLKNKQRQKKLVHELHERTKDELQTEYIGS